MRQALARPNRPRRRPALAGAADRLAERDGVRRRAPARGRYVPAGKVLGVGLACFGLWLALDARQLYTSAVAAPPGARRTVAMAILRPIARLSEALSLDRLVNLGNRALGRAGAPTPGGLSAAGPPPAAPSPPPTTLPGRARTGSRPPAPTRPKRSRAGLPPLAQPTPASPLRILEVGGSLGEDLGDGLADVLGGDPRVRLFPEAVGSTGLANAAYYDWPAVLARDLARYHPQVVVVMIGGNDAQAFAVGDRIATFGTAFWRAQYAQRVATMMREATAAGARVLWVGMPIMRSPAFSADMAELNGIYAAEARRFAGVRFLSTWKLFATPSGAYSAYRTEANGDVVVVRDPDGVHIAPPAGEELLAHAAVAAMERAFRIRL